MSMRQERDLEKEKKGGRDKREIKKWGGGGVGNQPQGLLLELLLGLLPWMQADGSHDNQ